MYSRIVPSQFLDLGTAVEKSEQGRVSAENIKLGHGHIIVENNAEQKEVPVKIIMYLLSYAAAETESVVSDSVKLHRIVLHCCSRLSLPSR